MRSAQAVDALASALEVTHDPQDHAGLLERLGYLQVFTSRRDEAQLNLTAAAHEYEALSDQVGVIRAVARRIQSYLSSAQIASAIDVAKPVRDLVDGLTETLDPAQAPEMSEAVALFAEAIGRTAFRSNDPTEAIRWCDRALALAEPLRLDETVASALVTKATSMTFANRYREGMALLEGAVVDARAHGQLVHALRGVNNLASNMAESDPRGSLERTREGLALARRLGLLSFDSYFAGNAVGAAERLGEWTWSTTALAELVDIAPDRLEVEWLAFCRDYHSVWTGEPDVTRAERILAAAIGENDFQTELNASSWLARAEFAAGRPDGALRRCEPFFRYAESDAGVADFAMVGRFALHAGRLDTAQRVLGLSKSRYEGVIDHDHANLRAGVAALEGRTDDAFALYRSALAGYREAGCRFDVALTILDMATLIGIDEPAVRTSVPEAREILESLGAQLLIERLDARAQRDVGPTPSPPRRSNAPSGAALDR